MRKTIVAADGRSARADRHHFRPGLAVARAITMIIPFAPGGGVDASGRIQAQRMGELLGQTIVVENVGAGAGTVGSLRVAQGHARRLHDADGQYRHPCLQPGPAQESAVQFRHRFRAGRTGDGIAAHPARAQGPAGEEPAGVRRLREKEPGQDAVRLRRRRLRYASAVRAAQLGDRRQGHAHSLQGRRPGDAGPDRRAHRLHVRHHPDRRRAGEGGHREGYRGDVAAARADHSRARDHRRAGPARASRRRCGTASSSRRARRTRSCAG